MQEIGDMATDFFQHLYTREDSVDPSALLDLFSPLVDADMNEKLCAAFSDKEISDALFQIGPLKAPGPDRFPARFLQRNWDLLREDIIKAVQAFFSSGVLLEQIMTRRLFLSRRRTIRRSLKIFDQSVSAMSSSK
jgi:hypothetical protein